MTTELLALGGAAAGVATAAALLVPRAWRRAQLSMAKQPGLAGHSRMALRLARWLPGYDHGESHFFGADDAPEAVQQRRRAGLRRLAAGFANRHPKTLELTQAARELISDLQFTGRYRVPFPFSRYLREQFGVGAFLEMAEGNQVRDLDGQRYLDLTGSYGVNVFGHAFYQRSMAEGARRALPLGVVLGSYHPAVLDVARRLTRLSGQDEVSFHMSGTEAVMQAVRLARYHTGRRQIVRFCGAYHGWWGEVQPGPGNPLPAEHTFTLRDMDARSLRVLRTRRDIACVLINPLQALHPNRPAPGDSALLGSRPIAPVDLEAYGRWLKQLREVCSERGIALIFDEVFVGFRLAPGGAQQLFGVQADLVTYGKTLGGGLPVGVVCGKAAWMRRFRDDKPADICFARGTFNAHPQVICAMQVFLEALDSPAIQDVYAGQAQRWDARVARFNAALQEAGHPVQVRHLQSIWTLAFPTPGRYHWMLQFYLREQGLLLSWVGSGRIVFSLDFSETDMDEVLRRFLAACAQMRADGWWDGAPSSKQLKRQLLLETWRAWRA
ncbi:aminotransferase class III-fold pyridoxal phosphate-dependent enzyme [Inhella sp.]|uniref:aminotransferase class III-fold pyridoxal phosphate-dependent enzyme n=1 Tax=Inhella sp. TaxID=1921806 RepID=UPI0035AE8870